jgi:hypothetical protein
VVRGIGCRSVFSLLAITRRSKHAIPSATPARLVGRNRCRQAPAMASKPMVRKPTDITKEGHIMTLKKALCGVFISLFVAAGIVMLAQPASAQPCPQQPDNPEEEMRCISDQMKNLRDQMKNLKDQAAQMKNNPDVTLAEVAALEGQAFDLDQMAIQLLLRAIEITRLCFISPEINIWIEVEKILVVIKQTFIVVIKFERIIIKQLIQVKIRFK